MVLSANTYYQGDSAITAMYQGDVLVYELNPLVIIGTILYTSTDGRIVQPRYTGSTYYGANIISNTYNDGQGIILFDNCVTLIGTGTFWYCTSLSSVTIPDSVTSIGIDAFYGCASLSLVTIGSGLTSIGNSAFSHCESLSSITIPSGVTEIGNSAFSACTNLRDIRYNGTMAQWGNIPKGFQWNYNVPATVVHCSDGDVPI